MNQILELLEQYLYLELLGLVLIQMIIMMSAIHKIKKLSRYVRSIRDGVEDYLETVLSDEDEPQTGSAHVVSGQERQMMDTIRQKKRQQEEVFDAVLQEIFP